MAQLLQDKDRIFQNLYGLRDHGLDAARDRGAWLGTAAMLAQGKDWLIDQIKTSGLRGRGGGPLCRRKSVIVRIIWWLTPMSPNRALVRIGIFCAMTRIC